MTARVAGVAIPCIKEPSFPPAPELTYPSCSSSRRVLAKSFLAPEPPSEVPADSPHHQGHIAFFLPMSAPSFALLPEHRILEVPPVQFSEALQIL